MDADAVFDDPYRDLALRWKDELQAKDAEIARLREALEEIISWVIPDGRDAQDVAREALKE